MVEMRVIVAILILSAVLAESSRTMEEQFKDFQRVYRKSYRTQAEYDRKLQIFKDNLVVAEKLTEDNHGSAVFGVTQFSDLTRDEFVNQYLLRAMEMEQFDGRRKTSFTGISNALGCVPDDVNFDWTSCGAATEVKNMGKCRAGWAIGALEGLESSHALRNGKLETLSVEQILGCNDENAGCNGGNITAAISYMSQTKGIMSEESYPYSSAGGVVESCKTSELVLDAPDKPSTSWKLTTHHPTSTSTSWKLTTHHPTSTSTSWKLTTHRPTSSTSSHSSGHSSTSSGSHSGTSSESSSPSGGDSSSQSSSKTGSTSSGKTGGSGTSSSTGTSTDSTGTSTDTGSTGTSTDTGSTDSSTGSTSGDSSTGSYDDDFEPSKKYVAMKPAAHFGGYSLLDGETGMYSQLSSVSGGPVVVAVDASAWALYISGIITSCGTRANHYAQVVGYISYGEDNAHWIIKNSWGTQWGENGHIYLAIGENTCSIGMSPVVIESTN